MLRRSLHSFNTSTTKRPHSKIIIWGTFGSAPARRLQPTELVIANLPPQAEFPSTWNFVACAAGSRHISLLTEEGHIVLIGSNKHGQIGRDTSQSLPENEPQFFDLDYQNPELEKPNAIACGCNYTIAYRRRRQLQKEESENKIETKTKQNAKIRAVVIGYNNAGQLGLGHKEILENRDGIAEWKPTATWWKNNNNTDDDDKQVEIDHIECGYNHTFAVLSDGRVFSFGTNQWGELGLGRSITDSPMHPKEIPFFSSNNNSNNNHTPSNSNNHNNHSSCSFKHYFSDIKAGNSFSLFLDNQGRVFACGTAARGQIPFAAQEPLVYPVQRDSRPLLMRVCNISCGADHLVFVTRARNKTKEEEIITRREKLYEAYKKKIAGGEEEQEEEKFFSDLIDAKTGNYKKCYEYEVFFRGAMPDVGVVNATGKLQKVELGAAQPPFQFVKSHASSTVLVDRNGNFFGLGANPEGQLGDWTLLLQQNKNNGEKTSADGNSEAKDHNNNNEKRKREVELFGEEIVEQIDKKMLELIEKNKIVKPDGFGIVWGDNAESLSAIDISRGSSREMPMLAVETLRKIEGLQKGGIDANKNNNIESFAEEDDDFSKPILTTRYDSKTRMSSSLGNEKIAVIPEWRDRLGLGNGFGILLDPLDEYDVRNFQKKINHVEENENYDDNNDDEFLCFMPPLTKSSGKASSFSEKEKMNREEKLRRKKRRKQNLKFW